ncbi:MAG: hypothetical protein ABFD13_01930 [Candidatus Cryosericum sp.]|nr:hypothetical protein [bacterium]
MKRVWTVFKESVSEWLTWWWFMLSLFTVPVLGLLTSFVGFTLARLENSERLRETINYGWFTHAYSSHFPYPSTTQFTLGQIVLWFLRKSIALFLVFLVMYYLLGIVPTVNNPDTRHRKLLLRTGAVFFVAHIFLDVIYMTIMQRFDSATLYSNLKVLELTTNFSMDLFTPISIVAFMSIGIISLLVGRGYGGESSVRIVAFRYVIWLSVFAVSIPPTLMRSLESQQFLGGTVTFLSAIQSLYGSS